MIVMLKLRNLDVSLEAARRLVTRYQIVPGHSSISILLCFPFKMKRRQTCPQFLARWEGTSFDHIRTGVHRAPCGCRLQVQPDVCQNVYQGVMGNSSNESCFTYFCFVPLLLIYRD